MVTDVTLSMFKTQANETDMNEWKKSEGTFIYGDGRAAEQSL